ncbi:MAG: PilW family protein, partial [Planctomycetota bacterium]
MRDVRHKKGFTLIELLLALIVTGIILAAVTTLAFAVGVANDTTDDTIQKQAQVRYAT